MGLCGRLATAVVAACAAGAIGGISVVPIPATSQDREDAAAQKDVSSDAPAIRASKASNQRSTMISASVHSTPRRPMPETSKTAQAPKDRTPQKLASLLVHGNTAAKAAGRSQHSGAKAAARGRHAVRSRRHHRARKAHHRRAHRRGTSRPRARTHKTKRGASTAKHAAAPVAPVAVIAHPDAALVANQSSHKRVLALAARKTDHRKKADLEARADRLVNKIITKLPTLRYQPLWNLVNPDALHSGQILDVPLRQISEELSPVGQKLRTAFPSIRFRDLPVFSDLPDPLPQGFSWANPLAESVSPQGELFASLPFHVRNTPPQALRLEDLSLVGEREVRINHHAAVQEWREKARETNFEHVDKDKRDSIHRLQQKNEALRKMKFEMEREYDVESANTKKLQKRAKEDAALIAKQQSLQEEQVVKEQQYQEVNNELATEDMEEQKALASSQSQEAQLVKVIELKDRARSMLQKQIEELRGQIGAEQQAEAKRADKLSKAQRLLRGKIQRAVDIGGKLEAKVRTLEATLKAEASDKMHLEKEDADLAAEDKQLELKNEEMQQVEAQQEQQRQALDAEVKNDRAGRDRLQGEVDALEQAQVGGSDQVAQGSPPAQTAGVDADSLPILPAQTAGVDADSLPILPDAAPDASSPADASAAGAEAVGPAVTPITGAAPMADAPPASSAAPLQPAALLKVGAGRGVGKGTAAAPAKAAAHQGSKPAPLLMRVAAGRGVSNATAAVPVTAAAHQGSKPAPPPMRADAGAAPAVVRAAPAKAAPADPTVEDDDDDDDEAITVTDVDF